MRDEGRPLRLEEGRKEVEKFRLKDWGIEELRDSRRSAAVGRALLFRLEELRKDDGRGMKGEGRWARDDGRGMKDDRRWTKNGG